MDTNSSHHKTKFILWLLAITVVLLAMAFLLTFLYGDKAKQMVVNEINNHLLVKVEVGEVEFTILRSFPDASVVFKNIATKPSDDQPEMPGLIHAGSVSFRFGIFSLFTDQYKIHRVRISDASISLWKDEKGENNYEIWKPSTAGSGKSVNFDVKSVRLIRVELNYRDLSSKADIALVIPDISLKGSKIGEIYDLSLKGRLLANRVMFDKNDYSLPAEAMLDLNLNFDQQEMAGTLSSSHLSISEIPIDIEGTFGASGPLYPMDLQIKLSRAEISKLIKLLPTRYTGSYLQYKPAGLLDAEIRLKGEAGENKLPAINASFTLQKGVIIHSQSKTKFSGLAAEGTYTSGKKFSEKLDMVSFSGSTGKSKFRGKGSVVNFSNPMIDLNLSTRLDLSELNGLLGKDQIENLKGSLTADIAYKGSASKEIKIARTASGTLIIHGAGFTLKQSGRDISGLEAHLELGNGFVYVDGLSLKSGDTDLKLKGRFQNLMEQFFFKDQPLYFDAEIESGNLDLEDLMALSATAKKSTESTKLFHPDLSFDVRLNIGKLKYRKFSASEASGALSLKNQVLKAENLRFKAMDGSITASGLMNTRYDNQYSVMCNADFKNVNIERLFYEFNDFGQTSLRSSHIRGRTDAQMQFSAMLDPSFDVDANSVIAMADVEVRNGELINFEPLQELSRFLDASELKNVKFSTLSNHIEITRQTVIIPEMEVKSSAMNLKGYGSHSFGNDIDYHLNVLLSEIGRKKRRNQPPEGSYVEDGSGRTRLFLHMTGTVDKPVIKYDRQAVIRKISDDFKNEKQELRQVIREEFKKDKTRIDKKTIPPVKFEVEWDEN